MCRSSESNSSPRVLRSPRSPQRAAAVCSITRTSSPRGQARCTLTPSTHASVWMARRTAARSTDRSPAPCTSVFTTRSTSTGATRWKRPDTATVSIGWFSIHSAPTAAPASTTGTPSTTPSARQLIFGSRQWVWRGLRRFFGRPIMFRGPSRAGARARRGHPCEAGFEHAPDELGEVDADRACGHRHEAVAGHPGNGVDFQQQRPAGGVHHEIRASPAGGADRVEGSERQALQMRLGALGEPRGTEVAGVVAEVFRFVVVEGLGGLDADRGQRLALENRHGVLLARDPRLGEHQRLELECGRERGREILGALDLGHADARALRGGLHDERQLQPLERQVEILWPRQHDEIRGRNADGERQALGAQLIHADGRAHHAASGVGNAQVLERALERPVLAPRAVERDPDALEARDEQVRERLIARIEGEGLDTARLEGFQHGVAREERDLALAGITAVEHRHAAELARIADSSQPPGLVGERHLQGTPTMRTSGCSATPWTRATVSRTCPMRCSRSAALAWPWLMMKFACFCDTEAPPMRKPLSPAASMRRAA